MKSKITLIVCAFMMTFAMMIGATTMSYAGEWYYPEPVDQPSYTDNVTGITIHKDDGIVMVQIYKSGKWEVITRQGCQLAKMNDFNIAKMDIHYDEQYNNYSYKPYGTAQYIDIENTKEITVTSRLIPDHICEYTSKVVDPKCTEQGYTEYSCPTCQTSWIDDYTEPLGHDYVNGVCTRCGEFDVNHPDFILGKTYDYNTGDVTPLGWVLIAMGVAFIIGIVTIIVGRRKNKD